MHLKTFIFGLMGGILICSSGEAQEPKTSSNFYTQSPETQTVEQRNSYSLANPVFEVELNHTPDALGILGNVALSATTGEEGIAIHPVPLPETLILYGGEDDDDYTSSGYSREPVITESMADQTFFEDDSLLAWNSESKLLERFELSWKRQELEPATINITDKTIDDIQTQSFELQITPAGKIPLQLDRVDAFEIIEDSLFVLGQGELDQVVAITSLTGMDESASWIIPGPLPEQRINGALFAIGDRILVAGGKHETASGDSFSPFMMYSDVTLPFGLSPFQRFFNPLPGKATSGISTDIHEMIVMVDDNSFEDMRALHMIQRGDGNRFLNWNSSDYKLGTVKAMASWEQGNQLITIGKMDSDEDYHLRSYYVPRSYSLRQQTRREVEDAHTRKIDFVSLKAALKRARNESGAVLVFNMASDDPRMEEATQVLIKPNSQIMTEDIIIARVFERDRETWQEIIDNNPNQKPFVLLNEEQLPISGVDTIESEPALFEFLKPLWINNAF